MTFRFITALMLFVPWVLPAQTIAEKKASLVENGGDLTPEMEKFLHQINLELNESRQEEHKLIQEVYQLYQQNAPEDSYHPLIAKIKELRTYIASLQESWREMATSQGRKEGYALWYQPESTLEQLITDYASQDYLYIMKPEIASIKISVDSNLPIPRASWSAIMETILTQNGVGIRQLNPFLRELYLLKDDLSAIKLITNKRQDLEVFAPDTRIAFVLTPEPAEVRRIGFFLENFANPDSTVVQQVGRDILVIGRVMDVHDLLRLYDFISANRGDKEYKAISLFKVTPDDMANVLHSIFSQTESPAMTGGEEGSSEGGSRRSGPRGGSEYNGLQVMTLGSQSNTLFLIGTSEEVRRAEDVIREIEEQIGGARQKVVFWYTVKHASPEELANVLSLVYNLMITSGAGYGPAPYGPPPGEDNNLPPIEQNTVVQQQPPPLQPYLPPQLYPRDPYFDSYYQQPVTPISPSYVFPALPDAYVPDIDQGNFIVDLKTGSIVMVVEADILPKIKDLLRKMDVPSKMVQLEVLLFEKKISKTNNYGLNLLRLGSAASQTTNASMLFNLPNALGAPTGIFDFLWSRERKSGIPAFDLHYRFLLSQDDVTINASPSVVTVNQTPAFIAILEEISVNTGILEVETAKGVTLKDAFQRAQYGITLQITPTIHIGDDEEGEGIDTISLDSDITFDTFDTLNQVVDGRPNVTRRNIKNLARVADGETVIIGGLRRKTTEDARDSIPFVGEIPGIGKLFSDISTRDDSTEMFIFITPKIVTDPACDLEWIRSEEMMRRPGDIPEFMCALVAAEECEKNRLFDGWMTTLFGHEPARCYSPGWQNLNTCEQSRGEYDGR